MTRKQKEDNRFARIKEKMMRRIASAAGREADDGDGVKANCTEVRGHHGEEVLLDDCEIMSAADFFK